LLRTTGWGNRRYPGANRRYPVLGALHTMGGMSDESQPLEPRTGAHGKVLVNDLTVADARHLLANEGGPLDTSQIALRVVSIAVVAGACAYAIWAGHATVWHLALPMAGEYLVLLVAVPVLYLVVRHEAMRKDTVGSLRLLAILAVAVAVGLGIQSYRGGVPLVEQASLDMQRALAWIVDHKMHWAILAAMAAVLLELPGRVANLYKHGPPFMAVGLGCGMQIAVLFLGCFLLPVVVSGTATRNAWILLAILTLAEILTIVMHLDIQRRLQKLDAR
jgi:hypothetical protein